MSTFDLYAAYYDLLYGHKDYAQEVQYINNLVKANSSIEAGSILELGSGTGGHASHLAQFGHTVSGIDLSPRMVEKAKANSANLPPEFSQRLKFEVGDIRSFRCDKQFDIVISLFHVICYQNSNSDLAAAFATARAHLKLGGLLIFDFWYGPGVLSDPPRNIERIVEDEIIYVKRHTTPKMLVNKNCVDVRFDVDVNVKATGEYQKIIEHHYRTHLTSFRSLN
jgi:SAM-dependent methyltransferase